MLKQVIMHHGAYGQDIGGRATHLTKHTAVSRTQFSCCRRSWKVSYARRLGSSAIKCWTLLPVGRLLAIASTHPSYSLLTRCTNSTPSAIAGTRSGRTKEVSSIDAGCEATSNRMSSTLSSMLRILFSFWVRTRPPSGFLKF